MRDGWTSWWLNTETWRSTMPRASHLGCKMGCPDGNGLPRAKPCCLPIPILRMVAKSVRTTKWVAMLLNHDVCWYIRWRIESETRFFKWVQIGLRPSTVWVGLRMGLRILLVALQHVQQGRPQNHKGKQVILEAATAVPGSTPKCCPIAKWKKCATHSELLLIWNRC